MDRMVVSTDKAPDAAAAYSQAVIAGDLVFTAGAVGVDPKTSKLVGDDIGSQTRQTLTNVQSVLEAAGTSLDRVVKSTVFLTDMGNFREMDAVYGEFFPAGPPARSTVEVGALGGNALVEIETIAVR